jgi:S1-C subfamily serine protease
MTVARDLNSNRLFLVSFLSGLLGGIVVVGVVLLLSTGSGLDSSATTVTVQQAPVLSGGLSVNEHPSSAPEVYERDAPGVVFINASGVTQAQTPTEILKGESGERQGTATGSGFEIDGNGDILTNWHILEGASRITIGFKHSHTVTAQLVGKDASHDLALLRVPVGGVTLHPLVLGESNAVKVGDGVLAIGNPFGLGGTLTTGVISALNRQITAPNGATINGVLQTDASVNPGNSGGPLVNDGGEVIGINSQIETSGYRGGSVGIAFAIPVDTAKRDLPKLGDTFEASEGR